MSAYNTLLTLTSGLHKQAAPLAVQPTGKALLTMQPTGNAVLDAFNQEHNITSQNPVSDSKDYIGYNPENIPQLVPTESKDLISQNPVSDSKDYIGYNPENIPQLVPTEIKDLKPLNAEQNQPAFTDKLKEWGQKGMEWLNGTTTIGDHAIPNYLLAGGGLLGTGGVLWGLKRLLSKNKKQRQLEALQQQAMLDKYAAARAMHAVDPTEGPAIPQRPTLNAASSLERLMQITRTRGTHNSDFGQHGMSSVKSASDTEKAKDPTEKGNVEKRPILDTKSSYARLVAMLGSHGQRNTCSCDLDMNAADKPC